MTNLLWIVVDCLRHDALSINGYRRETTPQLDEILSEDFVTFEDACTQSTFTFCSASSMFTGTYPSTHGVRTFSDRFPGDIHTLADYLAQADRESSALSGMNFFSKRWGLDRAFSTVHSLSEYKDQRECEQASAEEVIETFKEQLPDSGELFASVLWLFDLHTPWFHDSVFEGTNEQRALYDTEILYIDEQISSLFEYLETRGLYDDTLIIVTADHGDVFDEYHRFEGNLFADLAVRYDLPKVANVLTGNGYIGHLSKPGYEELLHVPLYVKFPGQSFAGISVNSQVELIDLLPTVLDVCEIEVLPRERHWQGRSLVPILDGNEEGREFAFAETHSRRCTGRYLTVRGEHHKLHRTEPPATSLRLFRDDPVVYASRKTFDRHTWLTDRTSNEREDISEAYPAVRHRFERRLCEWLAENERIGRRFTAKSEAVSDDVKRELENLGYL